jgi:diguanylate cyclase
MQVNRDATASAESLAAWREARELADPEVRRRVREVVRAHGAELADLFYERMLADPDAGRTLDHEVVHRRLHSSMMRWLDDLFDDATPPARLIEAQRITGQVHARIGVSSQLVLSGARLLKRAIARRLATHPADAPRLATAIQYVYEVMDLAMDAMDGAASADGARLARSDESFRIFFLTQDLRAERERQRTRLLEWAHELIVRNYWDLPALGAADATPKSPASPFAMWMEHKAGLLFEDAPEIHEIRSSMAQIEGVLLPRLQRARAEGTDAKAVVTDLDRGIERIKTLLGAMFDRAAASDGGRDDVTRLLNRRYLPAIVKREISLATSTHASFVLMLIGIERFATIARTLGPEATDLVVAQIADVIAESVRAGDFVFRVGDERFVVVVVEADTTSGTAVARGLVERLGKLVPRVPGGLAPGIVANIGVAPFDGHPDYQRLLERAERALDEAGSGGGDRVCIARPLD